MKITAVSRDHSSESGIALVVEPPLTEHTFDEFNLRMHASELGIVSVSLSAGHLLVNSAHFTPDLRKALEHLLSEAEDVTSGRAERKKAEADALDRELAVEAAAAGLGLPVA